MHKNIINLLFKRKQVYELKNVFTPTTSANISYITRENVENRLRKALDIPGKQVVIYGHSGSGKTTVLNHIPESVKFNANYPTKSLYFLMFKVFLQVLPFSPIG